MSVPRRVALVATGGTIAMGARHPFDWIDYGDSGIVHDAYVLCDRFADVLPGTELIPIPFRALGSVAIGWSDWLELLATAEHLVASDPDLNGIVVTHGTSTLEETAYFLHLTWQHEVPLVLVGAQRPLDTFGSDAIPNVRAAMAVAADEHIRGLGVVVVMNNEIFAAAEVSKTANFSLDAFASPWGPIGRVSAAGDVNVLRRPTASRFFVKPSSEPARVDIVLSHAGGDSVATKAFVAAGCRGLVIAGLPPGRAAAGERPALIEAVSQGVVVVLASRASRDPLPVQAYNVADGILSAGVHAPHKARILLMLALGANLDRATIQAKLLGQ